MSGAWLRRLLVMGLLGSPLTPARGGGYGGDLRFWHPLEPSAGTLLLLRFDASDLAGPAGVADSSPDQNAVGVVAQPGIAPDGRFGAALAVNGGALRVSLKRPLASDIAFLSASPHFAGDAWILLDRHPEAEGVILQRPFIAGRQNGWSLSVTHEGALVMRWRRHEGRQRPMEARTAPAAVPLNRWTHVAGIFRYGGHRGGVFVNGEEKGHTLYLDRWSGNDSPAVETEGGTVCVGNDDQGTSPFPGRLDEVRLSRDLLWLYPEPDSSWCDPRAARPLVTGAPYTPPESAVLLHADFDTPTAVALSPRKPGLTPTVPAHAELTRMPGVRGNAALGGFAFDQKDVLSRARGALEFWLRPVNWSNAQAYHVGVVAGPFTLYVFNTGVFIGPYVPLVVWFNPRSRVAFDGVFRPDEWRHLVFCWDGRDVRTYVDGEFCQHAHIAQGTFDQIAGGAPLSFCSGSAFDELYLYDRPLSPAEIRNCYLRYRDPQKLVPVPRISAEVTYLQGVSALLFTITRQEADAESCAVEIFRSDGRRRFTDRIKPLPQPGVPMVRGLPRLPDGRYRLTATFADAGGSPVATAARDFSVKHFPWEGNAIGKEPIIIPPYEPVAIEDRTLKPWGRSIRLAESGLPESIVSAGEEILAAPIALVAGRGEETLRLVGRRVRITDVPGQRVVNREDYLRPPLTSAIPPMQRKPCNGYQAQVCAEGRLGPLRADVSGVMDIDGWYQVKVTLTPAGTEPVALDYLDLQIPLAPGADTLYAQRQDGSAGPAARVNALGEFGDAPRKAGDSWNSTNLATDADWESFVPQVYVGSGERGLWWMAASKEGWAIRRGVPCVTVRREPDRVNLVLRIIGERAPCAAPRTFEFALLPTPVKPLERRWRELAWGWSRNRNSFVHDGTGYRWWGDSVDSFALHTDQDFANLAAFLRDPARQNPYYSWFHVLSAGVTSNVPLVLYGSTWMTGLGMEEFKYFGREWLGRDDWKPSPDYTHEGMPDYGNSYRWTTPEQLTASGVNFNSSFVDCFVWYHQRLVERCPVNGTWWDNSSLGLVTEFIPGRGPVQVWNTFLRRDLTRRLAVMGYQAGRRPWWLMNMHVDFSWSQVAWNVENDFYIGGGAAKDLIDQMGIGTFRAMLRTKGGIIHRLQSYLPPSLTAEEKALARRTILALALLHDVGDITPRWEKPAAALFEQTVGALEREIGFFSADPVFVPYWRQRIVGLPKSVMASFFVGKEKAAAILVNAGDAPAACDPVTFDVEPLGLSAVRNVRDTETGESLAVTPCAGEVEVKGLTIGRHDFRLLLLEP